MSSECSSASENSRQKTVPFLRQLVFNWNADDKYTKVRNLNMEVTNIFLTEHYGGNEAEKLLIMKTG